MLILTLRTDKIESEIGLYNDHNQLTYHTWQAHRILAETLHSQIAELLKSVDLSFDNIEGIVVYNGPGSFTGLRIGISVANALAYSLSIPIVGVTGENWRDIGRGQLISGAGHDIVMPDYGSEPHITTSKK